jgi:RecA/RadA recombinase
MREQVLKLEVDPYTSSKAVNFFDDDPEKALASLQRTSIGVPFMDEMLEGGPAPGELIGILAPSGGGKSTFSCMAASSVIGLHRHCYYLSTEQKLEGDLASRFYTLATGSHRSVFAAGWANVPSNIKLLFAERKADTNKYSHFVDATQTQYKSLEALFNPIRKARVSGEIVPALIIVDWWGRLADQIALNNPHVKSEADKRQFRRNLLHNMKQYAEELKCPIIILHQLTGQANKKSSKAKITSADAQEDATFNNMFDFCFVFGNRDSDDVFSITTDKARGQARTSRKQQLDGGHCLLTDVEGDYDSQAEALTVTQIEAQTGVVNGQKVSDFEGPA